MNTIETVLERGYTTDEEYETLEKEIGFTRFWVESEDESFWGLKLTEDKFVLGNQPIEFWGYPSVVGLVGVYKEGKRNVMQTKPSVELFVKTNRQISEDDVE